MCSKMYRGIFLLFVVALGVGSASAQDQDIITKRVHFKKGATSATLKGTISGRATHDYVLGAKAGQTLSIRMSSNNNLPYTLTCETAPARRLYSSPSVGAAGQATR